MREPTARYQRTAEMQQSVRVMWATPAYHLQEARLRRSTALRVPFARPRRTAPRNERVGPYSLHETSTRKMIVHGKGQCNQARNGTSQKLKRSSARASVVAPTTICGEKKNFLTNRSGSDYQLLYINSSAYHRAALWRAQDERLRLIYIIQQCVSVYRLMVMKVLSVRSQALPFKAGRTPL